MPLSQAMMDRLAAHGARMLGTTMEDLTFYAKTHAADAPVLVTVQGHWEDYSDHLVALHTAASERPMVLREDQRVRVATASITWKPTTYNEVVRHADGSRWRVISLEEGANRPWWFFQVRGVPTILTDLSWSQEGAGMPSGMLAPPIRPSVVAPPPQLFS